MNVFLYRELCPEILAELRHAYPEVQFRQSPRRDDLVAVLDWAEAIYGNPPAEALRRAPHLRWLQIVSSGFDEYTTLRETGVTVTTAHGIHAPIIAQHVLATVLWFARGMPHFAARQREDVWDRRPEVPQDLGCQTVGLLGYGEVGRAVARLLQPQGTTVLAVRRHASSDSSLSDNQAALVSVEELLARSDHLVLTLPLTPQTRGILDARRLAQMKPGAVLHNVSRGGLVDEEALLRRLRDGSLGGAALDVFAEEPLPATSPFWDLPNVLVTPHVAGHHRDLGGPILERFRENLRRRLAGEPLLHVADFARGY